MTRFALILTLAAGLSASLVAQSSTQQQPPPPPAEQKPDAKAAPTIAGKWTMSTQTDQGAMQSTMDLKLDGKKVTGTLASQMGETPLEGEYADGKLTFAITIQGGSGAMELWFTGALKENGTLAGTIDFGQGTLPWTASRAK